MTLRTITALMIILLPALAGGGPAAAGETTVEGAIRLSAEFSFGDGSFAETPVTVALKVRVDDLRLDDQGWRKRGSVRVVGEVRDDDGAVVDTMEKTFRIFRLPSDLESEKARFERLELPVKLAPGIYSLVLRVRDTGANDRDEETRLETTLRVPITADVEVPLTDRDRASVSVKLVEPWHRTLAGPTAIEVDVRLLAGDAVSELRLLVDGETVATLHAPPWRTEHDFGSAGAHHVIQAVALTANGHRGTALFNTSLEAGAAGFPAAGAAPVSTMEVALTSLRDDDLVSGPTLLEAVVTGIPEDEIERVAFLVDGEEVGQSDTQPWQALWDPGPVPGPHDVEVLAFDIEGRQAAARVKVEAIVTDLVEEVQRVLLNATIRDRQGKLVAGADKEEFRLFEDGTEQKILDLAVEDRPIKLAMLLDDSGSMEHDLAQAQSAAKRFMTRLRPEDQAMVVAFASEVTLLEGFTSDQHRLAAAVDRTKAEGGTAMYDGLIFALDRLGEPDDRVRRVIVLIGDGADSSSKTTIEEVMEKAAARDVLIYTIGFSGTGMARARMNAKGGMASGPYSSTLNNIHPGESTLRSLADEAGGRSFFVESAGALSETYDEIATELRSQYVFVYESDKDGTGGNWRSVEVKSRNRGKFEVRTRKGYRARGG